MEAVSVGVTSINYAHGESYVLKNIYITLEPICVGSSEMIRGTWAYNSDFDYWIHVDETILLEGNPCISLSPIMKGCSEKSKKKGTLTKLDWIKWARPILPLFLINFFTVVLTMSLNVNYVTP